MSGLKSLKRKAGDAFGNEEMTTAQTEKEINQLCTKLPIVSENMRLFSLSMRSLYADKAVGTQSKEARRFRKLRDDTRGDAIAYLEGILPVTTKFVASIGDYFEYYEALTMDEWWENLDDIIEEAEANRYACITLVKMHEAIMVPLKKRQDQAKVLVQEFGDLAERYREEADKLRETANTKHGWALGLAFVPFVNLIATPILGCSGDTDIAKAVAKRKEASIDEAAACVIANTLIPGLQHFINGLASIAGFFEVIQQELLSFKEKGKKARSATAPSKLHYKMMRSKAIEIKGGCRGFFAILPDVRTDFQAIPTKGTDRNYVDIWLEKQKQIIKENCKVPSLANALMKMIKGK